MQNKSSKLLSILLSFMMAITALMPIGGSAATMGTDYDNHWAKEAIVKALNAGILKGYPDGSIKPEQTMTRAEFYSMVNAAFGYTQEANVSFVDMYASAWYVPVLKIASAAGYLQSIDGYVRPDDYITRGEVAIYLRDIKNLGRAAVGTSLTDINTATPEAQEAILSILEAKIMQGTPNMTFMPKSKVKRSEALTALTNAMAYVSTNTVYKKIGTYGTANQTTTINTNVIIQSGDIVLKNMIINGNLIIDRDVYQGIVTLDNVTVKGNTYVNGGGADSIYFINVTAGNLYVSKTDGPVRIIASGTSDITNVMAASEVRLVETTLTSAGFRNITIENSTASTMQISLLGVAAESVKVKVHGITLISDVTSTISTLVVEAANTKVQGLGTIALAELKVSGTTFEKAPTRVVLADGVTAPQIVTPK